MSLIVHRGGWLATKADLAAVNVPEATESYHPVPYGRFVEEVELHIPRFGLSVQSSEFALAREGRQMFYRTNADAIRPLHDWTGIFERFWGHQLARVKERAESFGIRRRSRTPQAA